MVRREDMPLLRAESIRLVRSISAPRYERSVFSQHNPPLTDRISCPRAPFIAGLRSARVSDPAETADRRSPRPVFL